MKFQKFIIIGFIGTMIITGGMVISAQYNKPLEAKTNDSSIQVQPNKVISNEWDLNVTKIVMSSMPGTQKWAEMDFSFSNRNGLDKEMVPKGKIVGIVGMSSKLYAIDMTTLDTAYNQSKSARQNMDKQNGRIFKPGKFDFFVRLIVDGTEKNFIKAIYQDENGNNFDVPIQGIVPEIEAPNPDAK